MDRTIPVLVSESVTRTIDDARALTIRSGIEWTTPQLPCEEAVGRASGADNPVVRRAGFAEDSTAVSRHEPGGTDAS